MAEHSNKDVCDQLNSFLRGELSAVETYRDALTRINDPVERAELQECMRSHEERVRLLRDRILQLGGEPSKDSGPWGAIAMTAEGGAGVFGEKATITALEQGEDHGMADYKRDLDKLDVQTRQLVESTILPLQMQTHQRMSSLKHRMH